MTSAGDAPIGLTGGCQCGAVRNRLDASPKGSICHCRTCQKAGGSPFMAFGGIPAEAFVVTHGAIATFRSSEIAERGFFAACGTPLTYRFLGGGRVGVTLGSLDEPNAAAPDSQLGVESRIAWLAESLNAPEMTADEWLAHKRVVSVGTHQQPDHET